MKSIKSIGYLSLMFACVFAFQNCGSKGSFSQDQENPVLLDKNKSQTPLASLVGDYDVIAVSENRCSGDVCTAAQTVFKSKQTLSLKDKGIASGRAACNGFGGRYEVQLRPNDGTHIIAFKHLVSTMMACDLLKEEQLYLHALTNGYKISNTNSEKVDIYSTVKSEKHTASLVLHLRRKNVVVPPVKFQLVGDYKAVLLSRTVCKPVMGGTSTPCTSESVRFKSTQTVSFDAKGRISGRAACNSFSGKYVYTVRAKESTDLLSITDVYATEMACAHLSEEVALFDAFAKTYKVESVQNLHLRLLLPSGSLLLERVAQGL